MLITNIEELRLYFPTHAIDSIDPFIAVIDNAEHDFLSEKLGTPLYAALCQWYEDNADTYEKTIGKDTTEYNQLLLLCQRCIAYNVMARAIGLNIISINNAGINISTADDYGKADLAAVETFKTTCIKESHAAINRLLQTLEDWTEQSAQTSDPSDESEESEESEETTVPGDSVADTEKKEISDLWRSSRYFYLAASLLIPSARVLQDYLNFYESREKYILMIPDLHYIQEEIIAPAIGEDFCNYLVNLSIEGKGTPVERKTIVRLRKAMSAMLEERSTVIKLEKARAAHVHDESVRLLQAAIDYIKLHVKDFPAEAVENSPLYVAPKPEASEGTTVPGDSVAGQTYKNNQENSAIFLTPILD